MDKASIPLDFFKQLQGKHHHVRLLWVKWLAEYSHLLFKPDFVDNFMAEIKDKVTNSKLDASLLSYENIRDAYNLGLEYVSQGFKIEKKRSKPNYDTDLLKQVMSIIEHLNKRADKVYKLTKINIDPIMARFKEGYTFDDFITVIDKKALDWNNTDYAKYLRPETLFRPKNFQNYLNEPIKVKNNGKQSNIEKLSNATDIAKSFFN